MPYPVSPCCAWRTWATFYLFDKFYAIFYGSFSSYGIVYEVIDAEANDPEDWDKRMVAQVSVAQADQPHDICQRAIDMLAY